MSLSSTFLDIFIYVSRILVGTGNDFQASVQLSATVSKRESPAFARSCSWRFCSECCSSYNERGFRRRSKHRIDAETRTTGLEPKWFRVSSLSTSEAGLQQMIHRRLGVEDGTISANAVITIAIRLRYDYDSTTMYRARLLPFDASKKWTCQFFAVVIS